MKKVPKHQSSASGPRIVALVLSFFAVFVAALPVGPAPDAGTLSQITATPFFTFPISKEVENIVTRSNGQLLVTLDSDPELWQVDPFNPGVGYLVYTFPEKTAAFGIVESNVSDVFYVLAQNFTGLPDFYGFAGTSSVFIVDMRGTSVTVGGIQGVVVQRAVDIPNAQLLDGLVIVNSDRGLLLTGDAQLGTLIVIDVPDKTSTVVMADPAYAPLTQLRAAGLAHVGINGMKLHGNDLYFTNTAKGLLGKVTIDLNTGRPVSEVTTLVAYGLPVDDFSFDANGDMFISSDTTGILLRMYDSILNVKTSQYISVLSGADANTFGRTQQDQCVLYQNFQGAPSGVAALDLTSRGFCR